MALATRAFASQVFSIQYLPVVLTKLTPSMLSSIASPFMISGCASTNSYEPTSQLYQVPSGPPVSSAPTELNTRVLSFTNNPFARASESILASSSTAAMDEQSSSEPYH